MSKVVELAIKKYPRFAERRVGFIDGYVQALNEVANDIKAFIAVLNTKHNPDPLGSEEDCLADAEIQALELVLESINEKKE